jgi:hypothetical protein
MKIAFKTILLYLLVIPPCIASEYISTEIDFVKWGTAHDQLMIDKPGYEDVNFTPEDSSDDYIEIAGPTHGFVDKNENAYFISYQFLQLKAFDRTGRLIFDYSKGQQGYNHEFFGNSLAKIYVDSLCRLFILEGMRQDYIAVVDTAGHLLEKISPKGLGSGVAITNMHPGSDDALIIYLHGDEHYVYSAGKFHEGGSLAWFAKDGYYYYANYENSSIRFIKYRDPDIHGTPTSIEESFVASTGGPETNLVFLGVDDSLHLYVFLEGIEPADRKVQIYDTSHNLLWEIAFPQTANKYMWYMTPIMRPKDGNIYEFRCLDDGLHVIRWSRK